jgi:hypothetical protein
MMSSGGQGTRLWRAVSRAVLLALLAVAALVCPREARAQLYTHVGSFVVNTTGPARIDVNWATGTAFTPSAVIFFWTNQTAAGFANGASVGYGFATGPGAERAVAYASDNNVGPPPAAVRWQSDNATTRCIVILTGGAGGTDVEGQLASMGSQTFRVNWVKRNVAAIVHYLAIGGPDVTNAAVGDYTPNTASYPDEPVSVGFHPSFLMFLSIDTNTPTSAVTHGKVSIGFAGQRGSASPVTQGAITAVTRATGGNVVTSVWQQAGEAILEKNIGLSQTTLEAKVKSLDPTGFTITKTIDTCPPLGSNCADGANVETIVHYLALEGGAYKVGSVTRPMAAPPYSDAQAQYGVGFQPSGLAFFSWNLSSGGGGVNEHARISFSAADSDPTPNQRATFFEDHTDDNGVGCADGDPTWVRQGTSGTDTTPGKVAFLAQAGDCAQGWPDGSPETYTLSSGCTVTTPNPGPQCTGSARLIAEASITSYDPYGFTLYWTQNITTYNPPSGVLNDSSQNNTEIIFAAFGSNVTTPVELESFEASPSDGAVDLSWQTGSELKNLGFNLYRSTSESGPYERVTASLIPGLGSSATGASYGYRDTGLTNGVRYFYELEDVETTGKTTLHGPVSATPEPGLATGGSDGDAGSGGGSSSSDSDLSGESSPARVRYGHPEAVSLQLLRQSSQGLELELRTGGFYATPQGDGSVRLEVPTFEVVAPAGSPAIPVRRRFLEALAGRGVKIVSVVPHDVVGFSSLRPASAEAPELVVGRDGTVRAGHRRVRSVWNARGLYPQEAARVVSTAFQGEVKKALLELCPLRWDPASGRLLLAHRLRVRLVFAGREPGETSLGGSRGRARRPPHGRRNAPGATLVARLVARDAGLYAVGFDSLFGHGRPLAASQLRLSRLGEDVAFHLAPDPSRFGPGSVLYFLSDGASLSPYANEAVYELWQGTSGVQMPLASAPPSGSTLSYAVARQSWEQNRIYLSGLLEAPDLWLWDSLLSGTRKSYPFALSGLAASSEPATLSVWLQGGSDFDSSPDHHVRVFLNGFPVGDASWDGMTPHTIEAALSPGLLQPGSNLLELENVADTPAAYSMVFLDRFSLDYPRTLTASAGRFEARFPFAGSATLAGLGAGSVVLDTTDPSEDPAASPRWISGASVSPYGLALGAEVGHRYLAVSPRALLSPEIRRPSPGDLRSTRNQADYIVIAPREFLPAATPLVQLRQSQGLRSRAVALEEIFDAFGYGERSPLAIRDFLAYAYQHWSSPPPRYVLLLGDATYDPKDYAGTGVEDRVPAFIFKSSYLWTASDPAYAAVNGDDDLPDLAIGRLPASSLEQARSLVAKVLAYESGGFDLSGPAVLVADNPDEGGDFEKDADEITQGPLAGHSTEKIYLSRLGTAAARSAILDAFDHGASLMSYVGHGGTAVWASENILNSWDMASLAPQPQQPLVFTMNCLNGYFLPPTFDSLAEALVKADARGAIAAFSPSGLSLDEAAHVYHEALLEEILSGRYARLGDAILAAQSDYADSGAFPELLRLYHLFGDPALRIR